MRSLSIVNLNLSCIVTSFFAKCNMNRATHFSSMWLAHLSSSSGFEGQGFRPRTDAAPRSCSIPAMIWGWAGHWEKKNLSPRRSSLLHWGSLRASDQSSCSVFSAGSWNLDEFGICENKHCQLNAKPASHGKHSQPSGRSRFLVAWFIFILAHFNWTSCPSTYLSLSWKCCSHWEQNPAVIGVGPGSPFSITWLAKSHHRSHHRTRFASHGSKPKRPFSTKSKQIILLAHWRMSKKWEIWPDTVTESHGPRQPNLSSLINFDFSGPYVD